MVTKKKKLSCDDTIIAVITPPGEGGVAALRIAGNNCLSYLLKHFRPISKKKDKSFRPFLMRYGLFVNCNNVVIDEVMAVYMPQGKSYTGKEQVEIFCHGGRQVVEMIQDEIIADGARVALPGEFTRLAFLAGRIDLTKAEAVAEIIAANTNTSYKAAREHLLGAYGKQVNMLRNRLINIIADVEASIDYPEEEIDPANKSKLTDDLILIINSIKELVNTYKGGKIINEGFKIAIGGRPNVGKSSLFNLLLKQERALVTPTPGTTRDYISEWIELGGFKVNIIDTAGLRQKGGLIEQKGQKSAKKIIANTDLLVWMIDISQKSWETKLSNDLKTLKNTPIVMLGNKIDLIGNVQKLRPVLTKREIIQTSCKNGKGINIFKKQLVKRINEKMPDLTSGLVVTSSRHRQKLEIALKCLKRAGKKIKTGETPELTAFDLREAVNAIDEITGKVYNEDILGKIFSKFCIGK